MIARAFGRLNCTAILRVYNQSSAINSLLKNTVILKRNYDKKVIDHYENPRNVGSFAKEDENVGTGLVGAPACGDVMKLQIKVDNDGKICDAKFKTFGCGSAIASSSLATEWIKGFLHTQRAGRPFTTRMAPCYPVLTHLGFISALYDS